MRRRTLLGASLLGMPLGGCAAPNGGTGVVVTADLQAVVRAALADAARHAPGGTPPPALISAEHVTWPDGSLGCPQPGRAYTMALVRGYRVRVRIRSGRAELDYHAGERGMPFLCPPDRATEPAAGAQVD